MDVIRLTKKEKIRHLTIWALITAFTCIVDPPPPDKALILSITGVGLTMLSYIIVYYAHYLYIFPRFYRKSLLKLITFSFLVFIILLIIDYTEVYFISTMFGDPAEFEGAPVHDLGVILLIFFFIITTMAYGAYQNRLSIYNINSQYEREKVLLTKSIGFFQNQFNPHIIFNFLNYCYGTILKNSKDGAEAIALFSNMLRHSIMNKADEPIPLIKEIEYISDFIALHRQLSKSIEVNFQIIGDLKNQQILPRILITFIENAFKHGEIYSPEYPVKIKIETDINSIKLSVENKKQITEEIESIANKTRIGHFNVRQQLELFYKGKYELRISDKNENYLCELSLNTK